MRLAITGNSIQIDCTYEERLKAKEIGAFWDATNKRWYGVIIKKDGSRCITDEHIAKMREFGFDSIADQIIQKLGGKKEQFEAAEKAKQELELQKNKNKYDLPEHPLLKVGLSKLKMGLLDFQKQDVNFGLHRLDRAKSFCIFSQVGTGKSCQAIAMALAKETKCLIVCPATLKRNWEKEINKFTDETCFVVRTKKDLIKTEKIEAAKFVIINYDILEACEHLFINRFVVADEVQFCKTPEAKRTQLFYRYLDTAKICTLMSGTPMRNGIPDAFTLFSYCSPIYPNNYWQFCQRYSIEKEKRVGKNKTVKTFVGFNKENLSEFLAVQDAFSVRRRTKDVVRLPEMTEVTHYVDPEPISKFVDADLGNEADALINFIKNGGYEGAAKELKEKMSKWKKANAMSKAKACADYAINALDSDNPHMVIFSDHPDACKMIADILEKEGLKVGIIVGGTNMDLRAKYVTEFQAGNINAIIATIGAMATGVTLTKSQITIFNDVCWVPSDLEQAKARIYRIGQEKDCTTVYIIGTELDEIITKVIRRKGYDISKSLKNY